MENVPARGTGPHLLIADDHAMFAETLRVYLEKTFTVVGVVMDGHAMVTEALRLRPDVIVVDVSMPLLNGLDAAQKIKEQVPNIKFVFLTMRDDPNLAAAALELGVPFLLISVFSHGRKGSQLRHIGRHLPPLRPCPIT
jgi:DNA-binding NarL/FixJ family response regulator